MAKKEKVQLTPEEIADRKIRRSNGWTRFWAIFLSFAIVAGVFAFARSQGLGSASSDEITTAVTVVLLTHQIQARGMTALQTAVHQATHQHLQAQATQARQTQAQATLLQLLHLSTTLQRLLLTQKQATIGKEIAQLTTLTLARQQAFLTRSFRALTPIRT